MESITLQPFVAVTVTAYVPGLTTVFVADIPPAVQAYFVPPVADRVTRLTEHVKDPLLVRVKAGGIVSCVTVDVAVVVHPLDPVTVTV